MESSKRRCSLFISLIFLLKCFTKHFVIRNLQRDNQLSLFRRLEQLSVKQVKCDGAIEFLRLCQNFGVTPTFTKVDETKSNKWRQSSTQFAQNVILEELRLKSNKNAALKKQIADVYDEIRQNCSSFRYLCVLKTIVDLRKKQYHKLMSDHVSKIARLIQRDVDVDEHIQNISSYKLSFFQKLVLCRGLKFALPQRHISAMDVQASFEKAFWKLEPTIPEDKKELATATLRSIALNYIERKGPRPPKALVHSINQLKKRSDIVISKPDKGPGVVVMDKSDYVRLLSEASINDATKFKPVDSERPRRRGRPPKHYHPLLEKEKHLDSVVRRILPKHIAELLCPKGTGLAHLYGLPKTHKKHLAMRPILSATGTYNYALAKWLDEKLKPFSTNKYTISDIFEFAQEIQQLQFNKNDIFVSYDVSALFTSVPLEETIQILANKAFAGNWFNETHQLNITRDDLVELLRVATKHQLFQFNGHLYEQIDGVAMGSPWVHSWRMFSCVQSRRGWKARARCPLSTEGTWMTP